ncbi:MAG: single-stranded DNA-binding protein [Defluviitaleaceae bacterium]|nr:single-stranded DNA-binding protein [Defluviitaleaceae bacterium]
MLENISNHIGVAGRVHSDFEFSHEVYGEGFYKFDVEIYRLSSVSDILPVTISERIIDTSSISIGAWIYITGQIRSYNSYVEADRRNRLVLTVFARDVELLESGQDPLEKSELNPNDVYLNGFICKPPIYRTTPFGREIADILLAVNRSYNKSDYIPCIAWGRNARYAGKLVVGSNIKVWGRMQSRPYQKRFESGEVLEKTAYEVSVSKIDYSSDSDSTDSTDSTDA